MLDDKEQAHSLMASQSRRVLARLVTGVWSLCELLDLSPLETEPWIQLVLDTTGPQLIVKGEEAGQMMVSLSLVTPGLSASDWPVIRASDWFIRILC